jgi:hypothetical protein
MTTGQVAGVAWYRFRATFARRWGGYLSVVLLIGLIGGIAMASIAGGRRTQSSYPAFLASANTSDLDVSVYVPNGGAATAPLTAKFARLPGVKTVRDLAVPTFVPLTADGAPRLATLSDVQIVGSVDGMFLDLDRPGIVDGRRANPNRPDEIVMTASAARLVGVSVGQIVPLGFYTHSQSALPGFGTARVAPRLLVRAKLTGIAVLDNAVVQDDIDRAYGFVVLTPALMREAIAIAPEEGAPIAYGLKLDRGPRDVTKVQQEILRLIPPQATAEFHVTSRVLTEVELAVRPESVALASFGLIAAAVCLVLGLQAMARQLRLGDEDRRVMRALGAGPAASAWDGLIGILGAVAVGSLAAAAVAVGLSPLTPLGPVRPFYPGAGISFDWTVIGSGVAVLVVVLGAAAVAVSYNRAPHRLARIRQAATRTSSVARGAESAGMPVAAVIGVRFALEPGRGRTAVPVRSALSGTVLAVVVVVTALTFASSLSTLVSHPALYGWNWTYALNPTNSMPPLSLDLLRHDPDVAAWTGFDYNNFQIDGQSVPVLFASAHAAVAPPILSGHAVDTDNQIVMGAATLSVLHKHVGDKVLLSFGTAAAAPFYMPPTPLEIVGTATFPAVGFESVVADHTSMGSGALFSSGILPPAFQRAVQSPDPNLNGPELVFVRVRNSVSAAAGLADMQRIAAAANKVFAADPQAIGNQVGVLGVQRPAQIVNYRSIGSTPVVFAAGLGVGAIVALALTLAASVRRRRRDLALLKALGFTPRQLTFAVASQATVAAVVGIVAGIPIGIVVGRELWTLFARNLDAVASPTVPALSVLVVALGALVLANLAATLPGRDAARTPTAGLLQLE